MDKTKDTLDSLTSLVVKGFAAVADDLADIREKMATTADIAELRLELHSFRSDAEANFRSVRIELADIGKRFDGIEEQYANLKGVTREIDEVRARVRSIEKHLGIAKNIAA